MTSSSSSSESVVIKTTHKRKRKEEEEEEASSNNNKVIKITPLPGLTKDELQVKYNRFFDNNGDREPCVNWCGDEGVHYCQHCLDEERQHWIAYQRDGLIGKHRTFPGPFITCNDCFDCNHTSVDGYDNFDDVQFQLRDVYIQETIPCMPTVLCDIINNYVDVGWVEPEPEPESNDDEDEDSEDSDGFVSLSDKSSEEEEEEEEESYSESSSDDEDFHDDNISQTEQALPD